jgi:hypothetical protein
VKVQTSEFDVLIIGARAAGASLGLLLARQGRRVLIVDRDAFPSDTHSTHFMNPVAVGFLRQLGVLEPIEAAGFRVCPSNFQFELSAWFGLVHNFSESCNTDYLFAINVDNQIIRFEPGFGCR